MSGMHFSRKHTGSEFLWLAALLAALVATAVTAKAQTYTVLYTFTGGADGASPESGVVLDAEGNLYSATNFGGLFGGVCSHAGCGTLFALTPEGTENVLYSFSYYRVYNYHVAAPSRDFDGNFFGATYNGGNSSSCRHGCGTVYKLTPDGVMTALYKFNGYPDGAHPVGGVIRDTQGNLYGATHTGGAYKMGTVFKISSDGVETILCSFRGAVHGPAAGLIRDAQGNFYGTTPGGFGKPGGTVFEVTAGGVEKLLHKFTGGPDGFYPQAGLVLDAHGNLYGTTRYGGVYNSGTVFEVTASGVETVLHSFTGVEGGYPMGNLTFDTQGNLYGTTFEGGEHNAGTVFKLSPSGALTVLHSFTGGAEGGYPMSSVTFDTQGSLYGTTAGGGASGPYCPWYGCGVVFKLTP